MGSPCIALVFGATDEDAGLKSEREAQAERERGQDKPY